MKEIKTISIKCETSETVKLSEITDLQGNLKHREKVDYEKIKTSILKFGFSFPIFYTLLDGKKFCLDGHGRVSTLKQMEKEGYLIPELPAVKVECADMEEAKQKLLRLNSQYGSLSKESVLEFCSDIEINFDEIALPDSTLDFSNVSEEDAAETEGDDEAPEVDETEEPASKRGEIYELGNSLLMCGDSTSSEDVARLMGGEKADMVFTDPPYALVGNSTGLGSATDDMLKPFFLAIFQNICKFTHDLMHVYVCCDWKSCNAILTEAKKTKLTEKSLIVWDKESIGLGSPYMSQYELIWFFENHKQKTMQAGKTEYKNRRNIKGKSNVWKYKRVQNREHNAQKPVELIAEALNNSCFENEIVLDLFGGSGSTLIACEKNNRKCRMLELEPKYCDVIRKRYTLFAKQNGLKITSGCLE